MRGSSGRGSIAGLAILGLGVEAACVGLVVAGRAGPGAASVVPTLVAYFAASLLYLAAIAWVLARKPSSERGTLLLVVALAVVFRATLLAAPVTLTTDIWRYAWEGRVTLAGASPYASPPDDPALASLRDAGWSRVEHRGISAVYGPVAELAFVPAGLLPEAARPFGLKLVFGLADLATLALVVRALDRRRLPRALALVYAWHPLVLLEVAGQGHLDALAILLLVLALDLAETARPRLAGLALGLAAGAKLLPLALVPALGRRSGPRAAACALLAFAATWLPFASAGQALGRGLGTYAQEWRFNGAGFDAVEAGLRASGLGPPLARVLAGGDERAARDWPGRERPARVLVALLAGLAALVAAWKLTLERATFATLAAVLLLSPVVHPWYVLWLVPFLAWRTSAAWLELTLAVPVVYEVLARYDGTKASWHEAWWPRALWLGGFVAALGAGAAARRLATARRASTPRPVVE